MICHSCEQGFAVPLTRRVSGVIVEQCVDQCHDGYVLARGAGDESIGFLRNAMALFRAAGQRRHHTPEVAD